MGDMMALGLVRACCAVPCLSGEGGLRHVVVNATFLWSFFLPLIFHGCNGIPQIWFRDGTLRVQCWPHRNDLMSYVLLRCSSRGNGTAGEHIESDEAPQKFIL